ncbi:SMP-30/gluconolactonase/LRE family protein [Aspergillus undulatus]|uniref:SMP-30/gluconolactonase/LRE family protein n=1 Tax=Aspergillus undulatus TaxID=1810928 RepID=UPI003CCD17C5
MYSYLNLLPHFMNGTFNRSALDALWLTSEATDSRLSQTLDYANKTEFVAYDSKFFNIIGPDATIEHVQELAFQSHEAPCYLKDTNQLFFVKWGPPRGDNGTHPWQYLLDLDTNELIKIRTNPPTYNAHGCVYYNHSTYVVTDGYGDKQSGQLVRIDPRTLKQETLLNNFLVQPFAGFNDLEIDPRGNFYLTDSKSAWRRRIIDFAMPANPTVYFVQRDTYRMKPVHITDGNANGIAISPDGSTLYVPDTGVSKYYPTERTPYGNRDLSAFDISPSGSILSNRRLLSNPISYFYGIRVSRNGWIFCGAGDGVDVIDPETGFTLGTIRVGGGDNLAVSVAFGRYELWIAGRGGVWHVKGVRERLHRDW